MKVINKLLTEIKPYEKNPRINGDAVKPVAESIKQFGFKVPIVIDKDGVIIAGHTRYKASQLLELETVPCIVADDLTPEKIKAFRLADNKTGELAKWEKDLLNEELKSIIDIDMTLFTFDLSVNDITTEIDGEVKFTEVLDEENNYIVLKFNSSIDWTQLQTIFELEPKQAYSTRVNGVIKKNMKRIGTGRVVDGAEFLNKIGVMI